MPGFGKGEEMPVAKTYPDQQFQKVWRLSYPSVEKELLKDQSCAKKVVRLLQWFRDNCKDLSWVSSYYLKTAVMLEIKKDASQWSDKQLGGKLEEMLKILGRYLTRAYPPSLHNRSVNLLNHIRSKVKNKALERLIEFIWTNESVKILNKLIDLYLINQSGKAITLTSARIIVPQSKDLGEDGGIVIVT